MTPASDSEPYERRAPCETNSASETGLTVRGSGVGLVPLGLIGGMSWRSTALYYERLNRAIESRCGAPRNFPGMIATLDYSSLLAAAARGRWDQVEQAIVAAGKALELAGCRVVGLTAVTAHIVHSALQSALDIPVPHVLDAAAQRLEETGCTRVGLIATGHTCRATFAVDRLGAGGAREILLPPPQEQAAVDRLIDERLTRGLLLDEDRAFLRETAVMLRDKGAQDVLLACTELPLLGPFAPTASGEPLFMDAVDLHVQALCDLIVKAHDL